MKFRTLGVLGLSLVLLLVIIIITIRVISVSLMSRERVQKTLAEIFGQQFRVASASFDFWSGVELNQVQLPMPEKGYDFLKVKTVKIGFSQSKLLRGEFVVNKVTFVEPQIYIIDEQIPAVTSNNRVGGSPVVVAIQNGSVFFSDHNICQPDKVVQVANVNINLYPIDSNSYVLKGDFNAAQLGRWKIRADLDMKPLLLNASLESQNTDVGDSLYALLGPKYSGIWERYQPRGKVNVDASVTVGAQQPLDYKIKLACQKDGIRFVGFPYPVSNIEGNIELTAKGAQLKNLKGSNGATSVECNGSTDGYEKSAGFTLFFLINNLPLDDKLLNALPESDRKVWPQINPTGVVNSTVMINRKFGEDQKTDYHIKIYCKQADVQLEAFPLQVTDVTGEIEIFNESINLKSVAAKHNNSEIKIDGVITTASTATVAEMKLSIQAQNVETSDFNLKEAFKKMTRAGDKLWEKYQPAGPVDIDAVLTKNAGESAIDSKGTIQCNGASIKIGATFFPLSQLHGQIKYNTNFNDTRNLRLAVNSLSAINDQTTFTADGFIDNPSLDNQTSKNTNAETLSLNISIANLPLSQTDFYNLAPQELQETLRQIDLKGHADINLKLDNQAGSLPGEKKGLNYIGEIKIIETAWKLGVNLSDVTGSISLNGSFPIEPAPEHGPDASTIQEPVQNNLSDGHIAGSARFSKLRIENKLVSNLSFTFSYESRKLNFYEIKGNAYSGGLSGSLVMTLPALGAGPSSSPANQTITPTMTDMSMTISAPLEFQGQCNLVGLDIKELGRDTKFLGQDIAGKLSANLAFDGAGASLDKLNVQQGKASITDAELWQVPVFLSIYNIFGLKERSTFDQGEISFSIQQGRTDIRRLTLESKTLNLKGKGTMGLDGALDIQFDAQFPDSTIANLPIVKQLIKIFLGNIITLKVTGTFNNPKVETKTLPFL